MFRHADIAKIIVTLHFAAILLTPVPALACGWRQVRGDSLDFLWAALPLYCVAGVLYRLLTKSPHPKSLIPVALALGSLIAAAGMGAISGNGAWVLTPTVILAPAFLALPVVSTYRVASRRRFVAVCFVMVLFGWGMLSSLSTRHIDSFMEANEPVATSIVIF